MQSNGLSTSSRIIFLPRDTNRQMQNYSFTTGRRSLHVTNTGFYKVRFNLNYDDENPENIEPFDYVVSVDDASYFKHVSNGKWLALNEIEKNYIIFNQLNNEFVENYLP